MQPKTLFLMIYFRPNGKSFDCWVVTDVDAFFDVNGRPSLYVARKPNLSSWSLLICLVDFDRSCRPMYWRFHENALRIICLRLTFARRAASRIMAFTSFAKRIYIPGVQLLKFVLSILLKIGQLLF